ncbi:MAG: hypothetical protein JEZ04_04110 [Spirochaetales bacterium]|nr:hypothetical protein [Spirochaetales bacterium]
MTFKKLQQALLSVLTSLTVLIYFSSCGPVYELSVESSGGTITMNPVGGSYFENQVVSLNAQPSSGYYFTGWGNISSYSFDSALSDEISLTMPGESIRLTAAFAEKGKGWTFLIYLAGDNSLSGYASIDMNEMEQGLYDAFKAGNTNLGSDVKILVLADFSGSGNTALYLMSPDNSDVIVSSKITG